MYRRLAGQVSLIFPTRWIGLERLKEYAGMEGAEPMPINAEKDNNPCSPDSHGVFDKSTGLHIIFVKLNCLLRLVLLFSIRSSPQRDHATTLHWHWKLRLYTAMERLEIPCYGRVLFSGYIVQLLII